MKSHNKSNGQFSEFKLNQNSRTKAKPKGGWEDDEEEKPKEIKTQEMKNLEESPQTNFKEPEKVEQEPVKQSNANTSSQPKERSLKNSKPYIAM